MAIVFIVLLIFILAGFSNSEKYPVFAPVGKVAKTLRGWLLKAGLWLLKVPYLMVTAICGLCLWNSLGKFTCKWADFSGWAKFWCGLCTGLVWVAIACGLYAGRNAILDWLIQSLSA